MMAMANDQDQMLNTYVRMQPSRGVFRKRSSESMQQIYRRTPMPKCDFNKFQNNFIEITFRHECSLLNTVVIYFQNT